MRRVVRGADGASIGLIGKLISTYLTSLVTYYLMKGTLQKNFSFISHSLTLATCALCALFVCAYSYSGYVSAQSVSQESATQPSGVTFRDKLREGVVSPKTIEATYTDLYLHASPETITPGSSASLIWETDMDGCVSKGFRVYGAPFGSVKVMPTVTTTYGLFCWKTDTNGERFWASASTTVIVQEKEEEEELPPLTVSVSASPSRGYNPLTTTFHAVAGGGTGKYTYTWDFGDGNKSSAQSPSNTYFEARTYTARVTVSDGETNTVGSVAVIVDSSITPLPTDYKGIKDPSLVIPVPDTPLPAYGFFTDPIFGTRVERMMPGYNEYSELQAYNADKTLLLVDGRKIYDAKTKQFLHEVIYNQSWGAALRWSPNEPMELYYVSDINKNTPHEEFASVCQSRGAYSTAGALMKYTLARNGTTMTGKPSLVRCFPEYISLPKDQNWEEFSTDGRMVAMVGKLPDLHYEGFAYDVLSDKKYKPLYFGDALEPSTGKYYIRTPNSIRITHSGKYILVDFVQGTARFRGVEAYDFDMNYLGKVTTASTPHGSVGVDDDGNDVFVYDNANNPAAPFLGIRSVVKARIPNGVVWKAGTENDEWPQVDMAKTLETKASTVLMDVGWGKSTHVGCTAHAQKNFCVVSTVALGDRYVPNEQTGAVLPWQPFDDEVIQVFMDSTLDTPNLNRMVHHQSHASAYTQRGDPCNAPQDYRSMPMASVTFDGKYIVYTSNWGRRCPNPIPLDVYQIDSSQFSSVSKGADSRYLGNSLIAATAWSIANLEILNKGMGVGSVGPEVRLLQKILNRIGYPISTVGTGSLGAESDYFGAQTENSIRRFQCAYGIVCGGTPSTTGFGAVGPRTSEALIKSATNAD